MLKNQLQLLVQELTTLKGKIRSKLHEANGKLELQMKEIQRITELLNKSETQNAENERVLEQLLREFKELAEELC